MRRLSERLPQKSNTINADWLCVSDDVESECDEEFCMDDGLVCRAFYISSVVKLVVFF